MFACLLFFHLSYTNICWVIAMLSSEPGPGSSIKSVLQETSPTSRVSLWGTWFLRRPSVNNASSSSPHLHGTWAGPVTHFNQEATAKPILCQFWALGRPASFYMCASGSQDSMSETQLPCRKNYMKRLHGQECLWGNTEKEKGPPRKCLHWASEKLQLQPPSDCNNVRTTELPSQTQSICKTVRKTNP